jgi:hypothetical protein
MRESSGISDTGQDQIIHAIDRRMPLVWLHIPRETQNQQSENFVYGMHQVVFVGRKFK